MTDKKILLVDDNEHDVFLTRRALKKSNILNEVVVANNGQEALDYLFKNANGRRDQDQMPVVILLDLNMPRVDGFEVLQQIRSDTRTKYLPVVILTASKEEKDIIRGYDNGCSAYIIKPVDFNQFAEAVKQLGLCWLVLNEPPPVFNS